ncbi:MAG: prepilin-type N-terminal cleavage/methylation domain-containing protein [Puniceicoccales bacterium]|jgi:prepilin-type N-terminal cleavage/methylation domain-containing protein|nr:prepilin-type N-terminal cleavage/methylation domain-containing protein [Puniceicoccales bacterium]
MRFRKRKEGFTLVEILIGLAIASIALTTILGFVMVTLKVWTEFSGTQHKEQANRELVVPRFLSHEIAAMIMNLNELDGNNNVSFRKLNGSIAVEGSNDGYFYWQSQKPLPFLKEDNGGITECWLKLEEAKAMSTGTAPDLRELRLYYRSLKPGQSPNYSGLAGNAEHSVLLLRDCVGLNFGYVDKDYSSGGKKWCVKYYSTPRFPNFNGEPALPEFIQILTQK